MKLKKNVLILLILSLISCGSKTSASTSTSTSNQVTSYSEEISSEEEMIDDTDIINSKVDIIEKKEVVALDYTDTSIKELYKIAEIKSIFVGFACESTWNGDTGNNELLWKSDISESINNNTANNLRKFFSSSVSFYNGVDSNLNYLFEYIPKDIYKSYEDALKNELKFDVNLSTLEKGFYYNVAIFRDLDIYQEIIYNAQTNAITSKKFYFFGTNDIKNSVELVKLNTSDFNYSPLFMNRLQIVDKFSKDDLNEFVKNHPDIALGGIVQGNENTEKYKSGAADWLTSWSGWKTLCNISDEIKNCNIPINLYLLNFLGFRYITVTYSYDMSIYGKISYQFRVYDRAKDIKLLEETSPINSKDGEEKSERFLTVNMPIEYLMSAQELYIQINWKKREVLWGGDFTIHSYRFIFNIE